jgi:ATP-dependent Lhr-like helicase
MTDVGRLAHLLATAADTMLHIDLGRVSPMAVPVLIMIGREKTPQGTGEDALLIEAEGIAAEAMRLD